MTGEKWTAGPWMLSRCKTDATIRVVTAYPNASRCTVADTGPIGYGTGADWRADEEGMANARLIAAAPDLYEALRSVPKDDLSEGYTDRLIEWWHGPARAALAKARGER